MPLTSTPKNTRASYKFLMALAPSPSTARGDLVLQPSYFTSSLFAVPFRADVQRLVDRFSDAYAADTAAPFARFKQIWAEEGWLWMHLKVFDARTRETYLRVACRLFVERLGDNEPPLTRTAALFGLFAFFLTQPEDTHPPLLALKHVEIPLDTHNLLFALPTALASAELSSLAPYASHVLSVLTQKHVFHILPPSRCHPLNPRTLPREIFVPDEDTELLVEATAGPSTAGDAPAGGKPKKKGRPSKRELAKKTREAVAGLDRWLERTATPGPGPTHALLGSVPTGSLQQYAAQKAQLLDAAAGSGALERANMAVLARLRKIDEMAAERGLEVGGEGGERTGLGRVERVVGDFVGGGQGTGILGLLEGAGVDVMRAGKGQGEGFGQMSEMPAGGAEDEGQRSAVRLP